MNDDRACTELGIWQRVVETADGAALLDAVRDVDAGSVQDIARLRKKWSAADIAVALALSEARRRATTKFPDRETLVSDVAGIEQATGANVAQHKAARCARRGIDSIDDLCCGIGGDAMALAAIADVHAVDAMPLRAWMCERNAGCTARCGDALDLDLLGAAFHIDPSRRDEGTGRRVWRWADYEPGPAAIAALLERQPSAAIKLGPGIDAADLDLPVPHELELISAANRLVQAVAWTGDLREADPGVVTATSLTRRLMMRGEPGAVTTFASSSEALYVADPALERAGLLHLVADRHGLGELAPGLGVLGGDRDVDEPWLTRFVVHAECAGRTRDIRIWLRAHDGGIVDVKTRGGAVDPDPLSRELRGEGATSYIVFVLRLGERKRAYITQRG